MTRIERVKKEEKTSNKEILRAIMSQLLPSHKNSPIPSVQIFGSFGTSKPTTNRPAATRIVTAPPPAPRWFGHSGAPSSRWYKRDGSDPALEGRPWLRLAHDVLRWSRCRSDGREKDLEDLEDWRVHHLEVSLERGPREDRANAQRMMRFVPCFF